MKTKKQGGRCLYLKEKRLNVDIPPVLKTRIKVYCATNDIDIKVLVRDALTRDLDEREKQAKA